MEIGRSPRNRESPTKSGKLTGILVGTALYITYLQIYLNLKFVVINNKVKIESSLQFFCLIQLILNYAYRAA